MSRKKKEPRGIQGLLFAAVTVERCALGEKLSKKKPGPDGQPKAKPPVEVSVPEKRAFPEPGRRESAWDGPAEPLDIPDDGFELPEEHEPQFGLDLSRIEREVSGEYGIFLTVIHEPGNTFQPTSMVDKEDGRKGRFSSD